MADIAWKTPRGNLGRIPEGEYYEYQLAAEDITASIVRYFVVSGQVPPGLQVNQTTGKMSGVPIVARVDALSEYTFAFTVRATNDQGFIVDRQFSLVVAGLIPVKIIPRVKDLGTYYDGLIFKRQLEALEIDTTTPVKWSVVQGTLPTGLELSESGLLSGYLAPILDTTTGGPGWDVTSWDAQTWDFFGRYVTKTFEFLIEATDGYSLDRINYSFTVVARPFYTADNSIVITNETSLTIDINGRHEPVVLTPGGALPSIRQFTNYIYKFDAVDFDNDQIEYQLVSLNREFADTGLELDPNTGWLTGTVARQVSDSNDYHFQIRAGKKNELGITSQPVTYTLKVFGDLSNLVVWETNNNLGTIENGQVSVFSVQAVSPSGKSLYYARKDGDPGSLPNGLKLLPSGIISGQCSFQYFTLDQSFEVSTTFDHETTVFDTVYNVNIVARDYDNNLEAAKTFTIKVDVVNKTPYQNLYLTALPSIAQRGSFNDIITNTNLFPAELIYRSNDPYFGKATKIRSLFAAGLTPSELAEYAEAVKRNYCDKRITFGEIKTARASDENFQPLYEVVYIELLDNLTTTVNGQSVGPALTKNLLGQIRNPYYDAQGNELTVLEPNSFDNMTQRLTNGIGYINRGAFPRWMTSRQPSGQVLGLVHAVVLTYTIPGAADLIAFRLKQENINFGTIDFVADRFELDQRATKYFDIPVGRFLIQPETVFDTSIRTVNKTDAGAIDYAVTRPFDLINGRSKFFVQTSGAIDGAIDFADGDTVVFVQQEFYANYTGSYSGWFRTVVTPNSITETQVIPGYQEYSTGAAAVNQRAGVWQIRITNNIVTLEFLRAVDLNGQIIVKKGNTYQNVSLYYDPVIKAGQRVPGYTVSQGQALESSTTFDNSGTRFYSFRDNYTQPADDAKYIKFSQFGAIK